MAAGSGRAHDKRPAPHGGKRPQGFFWSKGTPEGRGLWGRLLSAGARNASLTIGHVKPHNRFSYFEIDCLAGFGTEFDAGVIEDFLLFEHPLATDWRCACKALYCEGLAELGFSAIAEVLADPVEEFVEFVYLAGLEASEGFRSCFESGTIVDIH